MRGTLVSSTHDPKKLQNKVCILLYRITSVVKIGQMPHTDSKGCFGFVQYSSQEQTHIIIFNKTSLDHRSNANTETGEKESISICAKEKWPGELCLRWWGNRCNHMQQ